MMWLRFLTIGFFSMTALSLLTFQSIEIFQAISDFISNKSQIK